MLKWLAAVAIAAPKRVIGIALLVMVAAGVFGAPVTKSLSAGGFTDPASESTKANELLTAKFGRSPSELMVTVTSEEGIRSPAATAVAGEIITMLKASPLVSGAITSPWTEPPAQALISRAGKTGLIVVGIQGGENEFAYNAQQLADQLPKDRDGVTVRAGGALMYSEFNTQSERDLVMMESIAIPVSFLALVWVFGGLLAAALPLLVGVFAIAGSLAVLRAVTFFTDVSIFALNLTAALGLALAIDYTLLIISRFRDEIAGGAERDEALTRTLVTAGRTVLFSALTVALSMSAMALFPMYFLRSFAYASVAVVFFAAAAAITVAPAAIVLLGPRLDSYDVRRLTRRVLRRPPRIDKPLRQSFWYRNTRFVMRHPIPVALVLVAVLLVLGSPFLGVRFGFPDDRVLPTSASSRQVGELLRNNLAADPAANVTVVVPDLSRVSPGILARYSAALSEVKDVTAVSSTEGTFIAGQQTGPPSAPTGIVDNSAYLTVETSTPVFSDASIEQLRLLHAVPGPSDQPVQMAGLTQLNQDSVASITSRLPLVLGVIAVITYILLFLLSGSILLPLKALVLNVLSLTATFGALVWIFQDGHLGGLGTTSTGTLVATIPVLMLCVAFGLSMDYEVFVLSRIREYWQASGKTREDSDESVALGLARTGRVVTAAALLMAISFAALLIAQVSFMKMFGLGLTIAVLVDATIVRVLLLPAFMRLLGRANWWAPAPLTRLHERIGLSEG